jgi:hypothetical protein
MMNNAVDGRGRDPEEGRVLEIDCSIGPGNQGKREEAEHQQ